MIDVREHHGAVETNGFESIEEITRTLDSLTGEVYWDDPELSKIFRLRLISDPGYPNWDVSYCYGTLKNGKNVRVQLPFHQLSKYNLKGDIIRYAQADGVYAKGIGILDDDVISRLS